MKQFLILILLIVSSSGFAFAQTAPAGTPTPTTSQTPAPRRQETPFEVSEYGVEFQADPRLIVTMAALEAAGYDPLPAGTEPSRFRTKLRKDLAALDPDLRSRMRTF